MSKLRELIEQCCPDGVEYKKLGDMAECISGATPSTKIKRYWLDGTIPWMSSGEVNKKVVENTDTFITQEGYDSCSTKMVRPGCVIIALAGQGKTRGTVALTKIELCTNQSLCSIDSNDEVLDEYLYHYLNANYEMLRNISDKGGGRGGLTLKHIRGLSIPVPSIEVQREIVRLLDVYTAAHDALVAKLNEEIELQAKCLATYRENLLTFGERVRWVTLDEVCNIGRGTYITGKEVIPGDVPVILGGKEPAYHHNAANHEGEAIIVSRSGVNAGYASYWDQPIFVSDGFVIDSPEVGVMLQYVYRYLEMKQSDLIAMNRGSGVPHITGKMLKDILVPVPGIDEQIDIVNELDNATCIHERLINELHEETELRKLQLVEFRNQLLSFPEKAA